MEPEANMKSPIDIYSKGVAPSRGMKLVSLITSLGPLRTIFFVSASMRSSYMLEAPTKLPPVASILPLNVPFVASMLPSANILKFWLAVTSPSSCILSAPSLMTLRVPPSPSGSVTVTPIRPTLPSAPCAYKPLPCAATTRPLRFFKLPSALKSSEIRALYFEVVIISLFARTFPLLSKFSAAILTTFSLCSNSVR